MQLHLLAVLTLSAAFAAAEADVDDGCGSCAPYNNDVLPGTRIQVEKTFSSFTLPGGQFKVFYAVLGKESALDLIRVHCVIDAPKDIHEDFSYVQVTVSNGRSSTSFSLPKLLRNDSLYYEDAHTIAPLEVDDFHYHHEQIITAIVSSRTFATITGKVRFANYDRSQYHVILPPSSPKVKILANQRAGYVRPLSYRLARKGVESVRLIIESKDDVCAKLTISGNKDVQQEMRNNEKSLTMDFTRRLDLMLYGDNFKSVMLMHIEIYLDDTPCSSRGSERNPNKLKILNITWSEVEDVDFLKPGTFFITCFLLPVICAVVYASVSRKRNINYRLDEIEIDQTLRSEQIAHLSDSAHLEDSSNDVHVEIRQEHYEYCTLSDHANAGERALVRNGIYTDFQQQEWSWTSAQFALILLPVLSFIVSSPTIGFKWKDDHCFHNYACAKPLWIFLSFNHVFSNVGYAFSGAFFLIFARMRKQKPSLGYGVHANYGIDLSMGLSLLCEALASSIYHICPNSVTYNLDTPFIEVLCVLLILKIHGSRRYVVSPQLANLAVTSVITLDSLITMFAVRGFVVAVIITALFLSISVLLSGPYHSFSFLRFSSKHHVPISVVIGTIILNIILTIACNFTSYHIETTQFVTVCCIANTFLYLLYYIVMKYRKKEKWCKFSKSCFVTAMFLWTAALLFFFEEETDWTLTPAESRAVNRPCILLNFFDYHDLWHMSSALASLFLLIGVSSFDDDLCAVLSKEVATSLRFCYKIKELISSTEQNLLKLQQKQRKTDS